MNSRNDVLTLFSNRKHKQTESGKEVSPDQKVFEVSLKSKQFKNEDFNPDFDALFGNCIWLVLL